MMNNSNTNDYPILGTLVNNDASGIIANANQIYDAVANKSVEERITDLDNKIESVGSLKALAFKDNATANFTPGGTISTPSFTGKEKDVTVSGSTQLNFNLESWVSEDSGAVNPSLGGEDDTNIAHVTPTAKATGANVDLNTTTVDSVSDIGALPQWDASVNGETLVFSWNRGRLPVTIKKTVATGVKNVTQPTITCKDIWIRVKNMTATMTSTGSYVPEGTNSTPIFTGTPQTITVK